MNSLSILNPIKGAPKTVIYVNRLFKCVIFFGRIYSTLSCQLDSYLTLNGTTILST